MGRYTHTYTHVQSASHNTCGAVERASPEILSTEPWTESGVGKKAYREANQHHRTAYQVGSPDKLQAPTHMFPQIDTGWDTILLTDDSYLRFTFN